MDDLLLHPQTAGELKNLVKTPRHAVMLYGEGGMGKTAIANWLRYTLLGSQRGRHEAHYMHITPLNNILGIDQVRALQRFLQLKIPGQDSIRRVVIVEGAHTMTDEAQNALLKVLEEPPSDTMIILTAIPGRHLRPTIHSRVQRIQLRVPDTSEAVMYFSKKGYTRKIVEKACLISNGRPGLMQALLQEDENHPLVKSINLAKSLLAASRYERLILVDELSKDKLGLPDLLTALKTVCRAALAQAVQRNHSQQAARWTTRLSHILASERILVHNPNQKLLISNLLLHL